MKIHEKIRYVRQTKDLSQEAMAEKLGLSVSAYGNIERGETNIQLTRLEQIAEIFKMNLMELLSFGERNVILIIGSGDNNCNNTQNFSSSENIKAELEKAHFTIEAQAKEIAYLKEIIDMLKAAKI